jgi:zinc protease
MRAPVRTALAAGLAVVLLWPAGAGAIEVERVVSPGGIEAWLVEAHAVPILSMRFAFRGGTKLDPEGKEGLAELASGLLNEGAGDMDALAFQKALDDRAIRMSFNAGIDEFRGTLETLTETRKEAFDLLALALSQPRFDADAVERVRSQLRDELERDAKNPRAVAEKLWYRTAFAGHPYARPSEGTIESVQAIEVADLRAWMAARIARDALVVGVAGDIDPDALAPLLDRVFGPLPASAAPARVPETLPDAHGVVLVERMPQPQSLVLWGQRGVARDDPDYYAAYVVNHILGGGGFTSRLTEEVREKRGLAYGVYCYLLPLDDAPLMMGGVATRNERVAESLDIVRAEYARLRDGGVSADELADAKTYITGSFPLSLDSNGEIAGRLVGMQIADLGIDYLDRRNGLIEAVTLEDADRVARDLLEPEDFTVVVVGDPTGIEPTGAAPSN